MNEQRSEGGVYGHVCVSGGGVSESQLDLAGVSGPGVSGYPGQRSPTVTSTLRQGSALVQRPYHFKELNTQTGLEHCPEPKQ